MEPVTLAVVSLAVLMLLLSFGVPIVFCFSGALAFMSIVGGVTMKGMMMWGLQQILSPTLLCIPLFIYAGSLMSESGIAKYLLEFVDVFVGRIRGGLGFVATPHLRHPRRDFGQYLYRARRHRQHADPRNGQPGLSPRLRHRAHHLFLHPRRAHSSEHAHDHLRLGDGHQRARLLPVHGGPRHRHHHHLLRHQFRAEPPLRPQAHAAALQNGKAQADRRARLEGAPGAHHARAHPRRHLFRGHDPHRSRRRSRNLRAAGRVLRLQGPEPA